MASCDDECMQLYGSSDSDTVNNMTVILSQADGSSLLGDLGREPLTKRRRSDDEPGDNGLSIKKMLMNMNKDICARLDNMENKLDAVIMSTSFLEERVEQMSTCLRGLQQAGPATSTTTPLKPGVRYSSLLKRRSGGAMIVGVPQSHDTPTAFAQLDDNITVQVEDGDFSSLDPSLHDLGPNVQLITLNTLADFPDGAWIGDESDPEMRVRVPITSSDLLHIHSNCLTPEKTALTLLDYLFNRETQASSNLSGLGKHGKKQLDPLLIYGIRCHLIHRFGISEQDWHRIKQNIDSKCRTAWRRKVKGLSLQVKAFRGKVPPPQTLIPVGLECDMSGDDSLQDVDCFHVLPMANGQPGVDLSGGVCQPVSAADLINSAGGEIQVLHATREQILQLQSEQGIQILTAADQEFLLMGDGQSNRFGVMEEESNGLLTTCKTEH